MIGDRLRATIRVLSAILIGSSLLALSAPAAAQAISPEQRRDLYGNWNTEIPPGIYSLAALHSGLCLGYSDVTEGAHFIQGRCGVTSSTVALLPHRRGGYTIRVGGSVNRFILDHGNPAERTQARHCATSARDVILGPRRIDILPCEFGAAAPSWCDAGAEDQRFRFHRVRANVYEIRGQPNAEGQNTCLDIAGQSLDEGAALILWECNGQANQRFELSPPRSIAGVAEEMRCLADRGWVETWEGMHRQVPVMGVDLPGADLGGGATADDGGRQCAASCGNYPPCRSFTWVRPGVQAAPDFKGITAVCWLKSGVPEPVANPDTASGIVRP